MKWERKRRLDEDNVTSFSLGLLELPKIRIQVERQMLRRND